MSRESKLVKNTAIISIGTVLPKVVSFVTLPLLTGYLTKAEYGTYDLVTVLVSLILPAATLQIQTAAFRFLINCRGKREECTRIISTIFAFAIPVAIAALVIVYGVLRMDRGLKLLICIYFLGDLLVNLARQVTRGLGKNMIYSTSVVISSVCIMLFVIWFVYVKRMGIYGAVLSLTVSQYLAFVYTLAVSGIFGYIKPSAVSRDILKELVSYSWPMVPNSMSMWVMRLSDRLVVTFFLGVEANAVYAAANKIPQILTFAQNTFTMAWQENASIYANDEDISAYYSRMFSYIFSFLAGATGMLIAFSPLLFRIFIRGDYDDALIQIPILLAGMLFSGLSAFLGGIYVAYMKTKSIGVTTIVAAGINLAIDFACVNQIGIFAASLSTLVSYIVLTIYRMIDVQKIVKITFPMRRIIVALLILGVQYVIYCFHSWPMYLLNAAAGCIMFWILNWTFLRVVLKKLVRRH